MAMASREQPEVRVSTASLGIDGEMETQKELDQGQHREGLAHRGGSEGGRWLLGFLVPEKLLSHAGGGAPAVQVLGGQAATSSSRYTVKNTIILAVLGIYCALIAKQNQSTGEQLCAAHQQ